MKKLLIVDDEDEITNFLAEFFQNLGYSVQTAGTKEEAFKVLLDYQPMVALLDVRMRGSDRAGLEILTWIKEKKLKTKTIMVTAVESKDVISEAMQIGADDYITKPLSLEYIETSVAQKIGSMMIE